MLFSIAHIYIANAKKCFEKSVYEINFVYKVNLLYNVISCTYILHGTNFSSVF